MTNKKISELPAVTTVAAGDLIPVVQGGTTKSATLTQVLASTSLALTVTTAQTNPYTANGNEFVPVDATSTPVTITLPTTPTNTTRVTVKKIDTSTNAVTISRGGTTDVFNKAGGSTSVSLTLQNQSITVQYAAGIWYVASGDLPLSQLDARYMTPAAVAATYLALTTALLDWGYSQSYRVVSANRDANEAITTASVVWPDGATGTFTTDTASTAFPGAIDAYHVTHVLAGTTKTVTQPAVTRDSGGAVTAQPALVVA